MFLDTLSPDEKSKEAEEATPAKNDQSLKPAREKIYYKRATVELIAVLLGVVFALIIDEIRRDYYERQTTLDSLQGIKEEILKNKNEILRLVPDQRVAVQKLSTLLSSPVTEPAKPFNILFAKNQIQIELPDILSASWKSSLNQNTLKKINPELLQILSKIEIYHDVLSHVTRLLLDRLYSEEFFTKTTDLDASVGVLAGLIIQAIADESKLLTFYDEAITKIDEIVNK